MNASQRRTVVAGFAAIAVTTAEMGESDDGVRAAVLGMVQRVGVFDRELLLEAAAAVGRLPQPLDESAEEVERQRLIREMLGVTSAADQLTAALRAREVLQALARDLPAAEGSS